MFTRRLLQVGACGRDEDSQRPCDDRTNQAFSLRRLFAGGWILGAMARFNTSQEGSTGGVLSVTISANCKVHRLIPFIA
jgi:hypothetical protein